VRSRTSRGNISRGSQITYGAGHISGSGVKLESAEPIFGIGSKAFIGLSIYAALLMGEADLKNGDAANALRKFQEAQTSCRFVRLRRISTWAAHIWLWEPFPRRPPS